MCNFLTLANFCSWGDGFELYLVKNPEDKFSHDKAQLEYGPVLAPKWLFSSRFLVKLSLCKV